MDYTAPLNEAAMSMAVRRIDRAQLAYWSIGSVLLVYVAVCTPQRSNVWGADAWEHHRAIVALMQNLWNPSNPTYATDEPSIRYSPYSVGLALLCRFTAIDPQHALSAAAIFNTFLLILSMHVFLRVYGLATIGPHVLIVMVILYGAVPGYANSFALADLPQQQVNPSALSFPIALFMWAILRHTAERRSAATAVLSTAMLGAICTLCHGHTGVFAFVGLFAVAAAARADLRMRLARRAVVIAAISFGLCAAWPWFSFLAAVLSKQDRLYWFNPIITRIMLTTWSAPVLFCVPLLLGLRRRELPRFCLIASAACYAFALVSFPTKSSVLARIGLPAMVLLHIAVGLYIHENRLFVPSNWRRIGRGLFSMNPTVAAPAVINTILLAALVYCLVPQLNLISRDPGLARGYIAPVFGKSDQALHLDSRFCRLLEPVGPRDVVLSDLITSWPVPSFRGRIVAGLHYETFTPDQPQRESDLQAFFCATDDHSREGVLRKYSVKWILLNADLIPAHQFSALHEPAAVTRQIDSLILMNADQWLAARRSTADRYEPAAGF